MSNFLKAAASYYGVPDETHGGARTAWVADESGRLMLVVEIPVRDDDLPAIVQRMRDMQAFKEAELAEAMCVASLPSQERMRAEYNALDRRSKSEFGSFSRYQEWRIGEALDAVVAEPSKAAEALADVVPPYVYLSPAECTPQQKARAVGQDEKGNYAVAVEDLTERQRIGRVFPDGTLMPARLDGADGTPTSNADDLGGLPG